MGGRLRRGDEGVADRAAGAEQHLAEVAEGDAHVRGDLDGRGAVVQ